MAHTLDYADRDFHGLCFVNLVDFDMKFGHRRDVDGYARNLSEFDQWLGQFQKLLGQEDAVMITADHGCDPGAAGTDHTREYVPLIIYGEGVEQGINLGTRDTFADIAATVASMMRVPLRTKGKSLWKDIKADK